MRPEEDRVAGRIKNLKGVNSRPSKDAKIGWVVWGVGDTEGTPFATLAQKVGYQPAEHPHLDDNDFDEDNEWAIVLVCSERELEAAAGKDDAIQGWAELSQCNKDTSPGFGEADDEEEEETDESESEEDESEEADDEEEDDDDDEDESDDDDESDDEDADDDEDAEV